MIVAMKCHLFATGKRRLFDG